MVGLGGKKSCGNFWKHRWSISSQLVVVCHNCIEKTIQSTTNFIKQVLENTDTRKRRLKIEAVTKMDHWFTMCQYKREKSKNLRYLPLFLLKFDSFGVKQACFT